MKKKLLLAIFYCCTLNLTAQSQTGLDVFNQEKNKITKNGMTVLAGWSVANLIYSGIATGQTDGSNKYFHQMNVMWGGINLGLAALGYFGIRNKKGLTVAQSLKQQAGIEKTYLFNLGLDVAYVAGGLYLKERGKTQTKNPQKLRGYGESIILQGAALFVLDAVLFTVHNRHGRKLYKMLDKVDLTTTGNGLAMVVSL